MKYAWVLVTFLFLGAAKAQVITVADIKVSVTAESLAVAREQALDQAHELAFHKLLSENFPEKLGALPSHDQIMNLVTNFSIDREKTTTKTYTASLTFQFDAPHVQSWLQHQGNIPAKNPLTSQNTSNESTLKLRATYTTLAQWRHIKKTLEGCKDIQKLVVQNFSSQNATLAVTCNQDIEKVKQYLSTNGLVLSPHEGGWVISPKD
ncbi:MAG: hypothetical protein JSR85_07225 [Proteobacteria bacterium]|nr:hypothetical protein [Pseudomonadota bacterium]